MDVAGQSLRGAGNVKQRPRLQPALSMTAISMPNRVWRISVIEMMRRSSESLYRVVRLGSGVEAVPVLKRVATRLKS